MSAPLAWHSIFSMYGFWLPNDPRGSGSDYVAAYELLRYGTATKVDSRRSVAAAPHDRRSRLSAKLVLKFSPVEITGRQAVAVAAGFSQAAREASYRIYACSILPDHVHMVLGAHERDVRTVIGHFKSRATRAVKAAELWPHEVRPLWGAHGWNVALALPADVERAIRYVEANPTREGKHPQRWSFVAPWDEVEARRWREVAAATCGASRKIGGAALRSQTAARARRERRG